MREELQELWDSIESRKWRVLETVARMPEDVQKRKMPGSAWTPLQLVEHLILAEEQQLKEVEAASTSTARPHRAMMYRSVVWVLRKGIRVPAPGTMLPSGNADSLEELNKRWDEARARMRAALDQAHDTKPFAAHAQIGALTVDQVLTITDAHLQYHQRQIGA